MDSRRSVQAHVSLDKTAPGTTVYSVLLLFLHRMAVTNRPLTRASYLKSIGDATDLSSAYDHPTKIPAQLIAEPAPRRMVRHLGDVARSDSGRSPSRDRSG